MGAVSHCRPEIELPQTQPNAPLPWENRWKVVKLWEQWFIIIFGSLSYVVVKTEILQIL